MQQQTVEELLFQLGEHIRSERVRQRLEQAQLAAEAGVARSVVSRLENGAGGTMRTFVAVIRALGKADWLATFAPRVTVDPMQLLLSQRPTSQRVKKRKSERGHNE